MSFDNVVRANPAQTTQMIETIENEYAVEVRKALQIITGSKDIQSSNGNKLYEIVKKLDIDTAREVLEIGADSYDNSFHKYPSASFWNDIKNEVLRKRRVWSAKAEVSKQQPGEERLRVQQMAREAMKKFAPPSKKDKEQNLYSKKFARYKKYVEDDLVRVEDPADYLFQQWIPRKQAEMIDVYYHDPVDWVKQREDDLGRM